MENMEIVNKYLPEAIKEFGLNWNTYEPDWGWGYWRFALEKIIPDFRERIGKLNEAVNVYNTAIMKFDELTRLGTVAVKKLNDLVCYARTTTITADGNQTMYDMIKDEIFNKDGSKLSLEEWLEIAGRIGEFVKKVGHDFLCEGKNLSTKNEENRRTSDLLNAFINVIENFFTALLCGYALETAHIKYKKKILRTAIKAFSASVTAYDYAQSYIKLGIDAVAKSDYYKEFSPHIDCMHKSAIETLHELKAILKNSKISGDLCLARFSVHDSYHLHHFQITNPIEM